jgi:hypothetical protein
MPQDAVEPVPTSEATTRETEPEVVAAIASGDTEPGQKLSFRVGGRGFGVGRLLMLLAGGVAVGYGAIRLARRRKPGPDAPV